MARIESQIELEQLITDLSEVLLQKQVQFEKIELECDQKPNSEGEVLVSLDVSPFNNDEKCAWHFKERRGEWFYYNGHWDAVPSSGYFRMPIHGIAFERRVPNEIVKEGLLGKLRRYIHYRDFFLRSIRYLVYQILPTRIFRGRETRHSKFDASLSKKGGITLEVERQTSNGIILTCVDTGGIYDSNPNTEGTQWPDQVVVDHYAAEYSAFTFYWLYKKTGEIFLLNAALNAIEFFIRNHRPYTLISFSAYEFKVMPLALLLHYYGNDIELEANNLVYRLKEVLTDDWLGYSPVNVHAMRLANSALLSSIDIKVSKLKRWLSVQILKNNQTNQGLLMDNIGGARVRNADLSYHQFSLACLAIALDTTEETELDDIFSCGLGFSEYIELEDGHVSYFGRGANNVYHLASFFYAQSTVHSDLDSLTSLISLYEQFLKPESGLPTALNNHSDMRMGWNHCATPYNAQVSLLLCLAADNFVRILGKRQCAASYPTGKRFDYLKLGEDKLQVVVGRGSDYYEWSDGAHQVGIGGICALTVFGENILLAVERSYSDVAWNTDIPISKDIEGPKIPIANLSFVGQEVVYEADWISCRYAVEGNILSVKTEIKNNKYKGDQIFSLSLMRKYVGRIIHSERGCEISLGNDVVLLLRTSITSNFQIEAVRSNPFGLGQRISASSIAQVPAYSWELEIISEKKKG